VQPQAVPARNKIDGFVIEDYPGKLFSTIVFRVQFWIKNLNAHIYKSPSDARQGHMMKPTTGYSNPNHQQE
jgi:hypothetical protein